MNYMEEYKKLNQRFENGCKYLQEHPEEEEKYLPELNKIAARMEEINKSLERKK